MERLTDRLESGISQFYAHNATNSPCRECEISSCPYDCRGCWFAHILDKLCVYEDAEEQEKLLVLPCTLVWFIADNHTEYALVMSRSIYDLSVREAMKVDKDGRYWSTKEQAEAVLDKARS